jgi:hypothetical protein
MTDDVGGVDGGGCFETRLELAIAMARLVPSASNEHLAKFRLALAAALQSMYTLTKHIMTTDGIETAFHPVINIETIGTAT